MIYIHLSMARSANIYINMSNIEQYRFSVPIQFVTAIIYFKRLNHAWIIVVLVGIALFGKNEV